MSQMLGKAGLLRFGDPVGATCAIQLNITYRTSQATLSRLLIAEAKVTSASAMTRRAHRGCIYKHKLALSRVMRSKLQICVQK